jgi:glycerophosphoryl diester phosphodiesterase
MSKQPPTPPALLSRLARIGALTLALPAAYVAAQWLLRERQRGPLEMVAHRGGAATAPENTMGAFRAAAAAGVLSWELDVQRSRDGELVVIHDDDLDRTTNGHGPVSIYSYVELSHLDAGSWFGPEWRREQIPTLREVIGLAQDVGGRILIELKSPHKYPGIEAQVVDLLARTGIGPDCMILSFDVSSLGRVHALDPSLVTDLNYVGRVLRPVPDIPGLGAIGPEWRLLLSNPARVRQAHNAGQLVYPWTVNSPRALRYLQYIGVDGIITDRLDLTAEAVAPPTDQETD